MLTDFGLARFLPPPAAESQAATRTESLTEANRQIERLDDRLAQSESTASHLNLQLYQLTADRQNLAADFEALQAKNSRRRRGTALPASRACG